MDVAVDHKVALVDEMITAVVKLYFGNEKSTYSDGVDITLSVKTGLSMIKEERRSFLAFTGLRWTFQLNTTSPSELKVVANNQVNSPNQTIPIKVVGESDHTPKWHKEEGNVLCPASTPHPDNVICSLLPSLPQNQLVK